MRLLLSFCCSGGSSTSAAKATSADNNGHQQSNSKQNSGATAAASTSKYVLALFTLLVGNFVGIRIGTMLPKLDMKVMMTTDESTSSSSASSSSSSSTTKKVDMEEEEQDYDSSSWLTEDMMDEYWNESLATTKATKAIGSPWGCAEVMSGTTPSFNMTNGNNNDSSRNNATLFQSMVPVLKEHCLIRPDLPLSELVPDLNFFQKIHQAVQSYPSPISVNAGRGTTATREIIHWTRKMGHAHIHHLGVSCRNSTTMRCMRTSLKRTHQDVRRKNIPNRNHLDILADGFQRTMSCGDCGHLILSDSPFVNIFTELYLALGPTTKVILSRRDAQEWTKSRRKNHPGGQRSSLICGGGWERVQDPFSFSQCKYVQTRQSDIEQQTGENVIIMEKSFAKFNTYVHWLVRGNHLLDINLFSSGIMDGSKNPRGEWSRLNKQLIQAFLKRPLESKSTAKAETTTTTTTTTAASQ